MPSIQNVVEIPSLAKLMVFVACAASIMRTGVQAVCCAAISHAFQSPFDYCGGTSVLYFRTLNAFRESSMYWAEISTHNIFVTTIAADAAEGEMFSLKKEYYTERGKFCCGVGSCNIFCCNCIGGCVKTEKFSGSYSGWPGFLFKRRYD